MKKIIFLLCFLLLSTPIQAKEINVLSSTDFLRLITQEKGKIIVVNFFASWCSPCVIEMPDFIKIRNKYSEKDVLIIGLSLDEKDNELNKFLDKINLNFPVYKALDELAYAYRVSTIPHTVIYSQELKTIYNKSGILSFNELDAIISKNL